MSNPEMQQYTDIDPTIVSHVEQNIVEADDSVRRCVDGGYPPSPETDGSVAFPGADLGTVQALVAIGHELQQAFDLVHGLAVSKGEKFYWHTDTHEAEGSCVIGCGHCNAAIAQGDNERYGVESSVVSSMLDIIRAKQQESPDTMELVTLDREHTEGAILVVDSQDLTVKPWDLDTGNMFFVYDATRHQAYLAELAEYASQNDTDLDSEKLGEAVNKQMDSTLGLLSTSKGAQIIEVKFDEEGVPALSVVGNAPDYS